MPEAFPLEFRWDVIAVARKREAMPQIAEHFGISESCLHRWLTLAGVDDGVRSGVTGSEPAELRELRKRNKDRGAGERDPCSGWQNSSPARSPQNEVPADP